MDSDELQEHWTSGYVSFISRIFRIPSHGGLLLLMCITCTNFLLNIPCMMQKHILAVLLANSFVDSLH